ncbi:hypothetical protein VB002_14500 [Campylobacter concisus]
MSFSIKKLFSNLFLSAVIEGNECVFYGQVFRNGKLIKTINAKFTDISIENVDEKVIKYIEEQEKAYFGVYISLFLTTTHKVRCLLLTLTSIKNLTSTRKI